MSPFDNFWFAYGVPAGALIFAGAMYLWFRHESHRLDRKYGRH